MDDGGLNKPPRVRRGFFIFSESNDATLTEVQCFVVYDIYSKRVGRTGSRVALKRPPAGAEWGSKSMTSLTRIGAFAGICACTDTYLTSNLSPSDRLPSPMQGQEREVNAGTLGEKFERPHATRRKDRADEDIREPRTLPLSL